MNIYLPYLNSNYLSLSLSAFAGAEDNGLVSGHAAHLGALIRQHVRIRFS